MCRLRRPIGSRYCTFYPVYPGTGYRCGLLSLFRRMSTSGMLDSLVWIPEDIRELLNWSILVNAAWTCTVCIWMLRCPTGNSILSYIRFHVTATLSYPNDFQLLSLDWHLLYILYKLYTIVHHCTPLYTIVHHCVPVHIELSTVSTSVYWISTACATEIFSN